MALALLFGGAAQGAVAAPMLYRCVLNARPVHSFMSRKYNFVYDARTGAVHAVDGLIWTTLHKWIPVKLQTADARRVTFGWTVRRVKGLSDGLPATLPGVRETATIVLGPMRLFVTQYPLGADNSFSAQGSCSETPWQPRRG